MGPQGRCGAGGGSGSRENGYLVKFFTNICTLNSLPDDNAAATASTANPLLSACLASCRQAREQ
jgi:hypothetical protein